MIRIRGLHKRYATPGGSYHALRGIDLDIAPGEIFGIIGPSGAGKSTLVQCINLLERPDAGSIAIGGQELAGLDEAELRRHRHRIGMVFQGFHLMTRRTVAQNVALPLEIAGMARADIARRVEQSLQRVGLSALHERYPAQISGGQKQRVGIARALANAPDVLLSDEATSALDPETTASILALLRRINQETGITVVMITHQMEVVRQACDRVAVLDHGLIVEQGATSAVLSAPRHPVTRAMVAAASASELGAESRDVLRRRLQLARAAHPGVAFEAWQVQLAGEAAGRLLPALASEHGFEWSLLQARVDDVQGAAVGSVHVWVQGSAESLRAARASAASRGIAVEVLQP